MGGTPPGRSAGRGLVGTPSIRLIGLIGRDDTEAPCTPPILDAYCRKGQYVRMTTDTVRSTYDAISPKEQRFVDEYVKSMNQSQAAIAMGYGKKTAGISAYQIIRRPHVALAIAKALEEKTLLARIDASWVLKRLALLADFSLKNFIVVDDNGRLYYDFASASDDDWYCIDEITIGATRAHHRQGDKLWVDQVKIKATPRIKALELLGKHVDVQAFRERAGGGDTPVTEVTRVVVQVQTGPTTVVTGSPTPATPALDA